MPKKKNLLSKPAALVLIILMMASTIAMIVGIFLQPSNKIELPQNRIIKYKLSETQVKELLRGYYTVLEYDYPSYCLDCTTFLNNLEYWTMSSDNQMYLQEIQVDSSSSSKLTIVSLRGQKTIYDPNVDEARETICDLLIEQSIFCLNLNMPEVENNSTGNSTIVNQTMG